MASRLNISGKGLPEAKPGEPGASIVRTNGNHTVDAISAAEIAEINARFVSTMAAHDPGYANVGKTNVIPTAEGYARIDDALASVCDPFDRWRKAEKQLDAKHADQAAELRSLWQAIPDAILLMRSKCFTKLNGGEWLDTIVQTITGKKAGTSGETPATKTAEQPVVETAKHVPGTKASASKKRDNRNSQVNGTKKATANRSFPPVDDDAAWEKLLKVQPKR